MSINSGQENKLLYSYNEMFYSYKSIKIATGTAWVDLKDMVLSKEAKTHKNTYNFFLIKLKKYVE